MEPVLLLAICGIFAIVYLLLQRRTKWPPGPPGLPVFGNSFQLDENKLHIQISEWHKQYGPVVHFKLMSQHILSVGGYDEIRQVFINQGTPFGDRPHDFRVNYLLNNNSCVLWRNMSPAWSEMKKNMLASVKWYAGEQSHVENITLELLEELVSIMFGKEGAPFDPRPLFIDSVNGVVASVACGSRVPSSLMPGMKEVVEHSSLIGRPGGPGRELDALPWLRFFPSAAMKEMTRVRDIKDKVVNDIVASRKDVYDPDHPDSMIDKMWVLQEKEKMEHGKNVVYTDAFIREGIAEFLVAGTVTTISTLLSFVSFCVNFPGLQDRIQADIHKVLGERRPRLADRASLPYLEAAIMETLRYTSHLPFGVMHATSEGAKLCGYSIPPKTWVWANTWYEHRDESFWEDPWEFKPERFLDGEGQLLPHDDPKRKRLMPFGAGRRVCVGEVLAKNRLFLILATLLQKFTFKLPEGAPKPQSDPRQYQFSIVMRPDPFEIIAAPREDTV